MKKAFNTVVFSILAIFFLLVLNPTILPALCDDTKLVWVLENNHWWIYVYNSDGELIDRYPAAE